MVIPVLMHCYKCTAIEQVIAISQKYHTSDRVPELLLTLNIMGNSLFDGLGTTPSATIPAVFV